MQAVGLTGINVVVETPNHVLSNLAASPAAAASWVRSNIQAYPKVSFRYVCVGNEVDGGATRNLVPAMKNVHGALTSAGLGHIKVTTSVSQAILGVYSPPSAGSFTAEAAAFMGPVVQFLARTGAPLMANIYPYLAWASFTEDVVISHQARGGLPEPTFPGYDLWENPLTPCMCRA